MRLGLRRRRFAGLRATGAKQPPKEGVEVKERIAALSNWRAVPTPEAPGGGECSSAGGEGQARWWLPSARVGAPGAPAGERGCHGQLEENLVLKAIY